MADELRLPEVKLARTPIDFGQECMDPVAKIIILEAMQYAIETAGRRLNSIGKIFSTVEDSGIKTLAVVNEVKKQIVAYPDCKLGKEAPLVQSISPIPRPPSVISTPKAFVQELGTKPKMEAPPVAKKTPKKVGRTGRGQSARWQKVEVINEKGESVFYDNPTLAAKAMGVDWEGARNMVHAFKRAGFEVSGNGEPVLGVGRFVIKPTGKPIPEQYKLRLQPKILPKTKVEPEKSIIRLLPQYVIESSEGKTDRKKITGYFIVGKSGAKTGQVNIAEAQALLDEGKAILD